MNVSITLSLAEWGAPEDSEMTQESKSLKDSLIGILGGCMIYVRCMGIFFLYSVCTLSSRKIILGRKKLTKNTSCVCVKSWKLDTLFWSQFGSFQRRGVTFFILHLDV